MQPYLHVSLGVLYESELATQRLQSFYDAVRDSSIKGWEYYEFSEHCDDGVIQFSGFAQSLPDLNGCEYFEFTGQSVQQVVGEALQHIDDASASLQSHGFAALVPLIKIYVHTAEY